MKVPLNLHLTPAERDVFHRAAKIKGLPTAAWARTVLREEGERTLEKVGEKADFLKHEKDVEPQPAAV